MMLAFFVHCKIFFTLLQMELSNEQYFSGYILDWGKTVDTETREVHRLAYKVGSRPHPSQLEMEVVGL